jgi:transposase
VEIIEENNDATLKELTEMLELKTGIKVSISTLGRISNQLNYTFKKKTLTSGRENKRTSSKSPRRILGKNPGYQGRRPDFYR